MSRITWGTTISTGITASIAIIAFMLLIPRVLGFGAMDITRDMGMAFSTQSPYVAGAMFLALLGIFWAAIFSLVYNSLPGNYLSKGTIFGLIVGLISLIIQPSIMTALDAMVGAPNQYTAIPFSMNTHGVITLAAYVVFGIAMALSYRPAESPTS